MMESEVPDSSRCPHLHMAFADEITKNDLLRKFKSVVTWNAHRAQEAKDRHPAKRRKVRRDVSADENSTNI
jgi:hypothetical protein